MAQLPNEASERAEEVRMEDEEQRQRKTKTLGWVAELTIPGSVTGDISVTNAASQQRWAPVTGTGPVRSRPDRDLTGVRLMLDQTGPDRTGVGQC